MNDQPRRKLCEMVTRYGRSLSEDPRRCQSLLRDVFKGEYRREINILVLAIKDRAYVDILTAPGVPCEVSMSRLTQRLCEDLALVESAARWAVESWALALGVTPNVGPSVRNDRGNTPSLKPRESSLARRETGVAASSEAAARSAKPKPNRTTPLSALLATKPLERDAMPSATLLAARLKPTSDTRIEIALRPGLTTLGRITKNDIVLSGDPYLSGRHAEILLDETGCYLTDLGSSNGTLVNGTRLEPHHKTLLVHGDEVSLGLGTYLFESPGEAAPCAAEGNPRT